MASKIQTYSATEVSDTPMGPKMRPTDLPGGRGTAIQAGQDIVSFGQDQEAQNDQLIAAAARVSARTDTISRVNSETSFDKIVSDLTINMESTVDMTDPTQAIIFNDKLKEKGATVLETFTGGPAAKAKLIENMEKARSESHITFSQKVAKFGREKVNKYVDVKTKGIIEQVLIDGDLAGGFVDLADTIENVQDGMGTSEEQTKYDIGRETMTMALFSKHMEHGQVGLAEGLMATPGADVFLTDKSRRKMRSDVIVHKKAQVAGKLKAEQEIQQIEHFIGRKMTKEELVRKAGLAPKDGPQTMSDKVAEFVEVMKRDPNEDELAKLTGTYIASSEGRMTLAQKFTDFEEAYKRPPNEVEKAKLGGTFVAEASGKKSVSQIIAEKEAALKRPLTLEEREREVLKAKESSKSLFGNSLTGLAKEYTAIESPSFANRADGEDPEGDRLYMNHVASLLIPVQYTDPITKEKRFVVPPLVPSTRDALIRRGHNIEELSTGFRPDQETPEGVDDPVFEDGTGMFDNADLLTGVGSALTAGVGDLPLGLGAAARSVLGTETTSKTIRARSRFTKQLSSLVTALQNSPRFNEGERVQVRKDIALDLTAFSAPEAFRDKLVGLDEALENQVKVLQKVADMPGLPREELAATLTNLTRVMMFRKSVLQVPPLVTSLADAAKYPVGTKVRDAQGNTGVTKEQPKTEGN